MRLALALTAALGLTGLSLTAFAEPPKADPPKAGDTKTFEDKFEVKVSRVDGKLEISIDGKATKDSAGKETQWYVNRDYPVRLKVVGAKVTKADLTKDDAKFEGTEKTGKAKKAKWSTPVSDKAAATIEYKLVVCSESSCSPPISGKFTETQALPPPKPKGK